MSANQIGDVLLSTADSDVEVQALNGRKFTVTVQRAGDESKVNIYYFVESKDHFVFAAYADQALENQWTVKGELRYDCAAGSREAAATLQFARQF